ncbi:alpha/beta fold hydrolase [Streptomyces sp. NPDC059893]|uniref:alpha/beta fold hydrolase n=1 Tax=Streptomyces sp. NPDC059893 TaxID=3346990 RepID=UPI00364DB823
MRSTARQRRSKTRVALALAATLALTTPTHAHAQGADHGGVHCQKLTQRAEFTSGGRQVPYTLVGELCATSHRLRQARSGRSTVQVLIHGSTYNHTYWDFGTVNGEHYSYARRAAAAGFPTFAFDKVGFGASSHPDSSLLTIPVAGDVTHHVVQGLRDGSLAGVRFGKVISVGHSWGSVTAWREAIDHRDVDGVIVTGLIHSDSVNDDLPQYSHRALDDPKYRGTHLDPGYATTSPGSRGRLFHNPADADPDVIAADDNNTPATDQDFHTEVGKDLDPGGEQDGYAMLFSEETRAIRVPVLVVMGSADRLLCGPSTQGGNFDCSSGAAIARQEAAHYAPQARLTACSVPGAGHSIALSRHHGIQDAAAAAWSFSMIGQNGRLRRTPLPAACGAAVAPSPLRGLPPVLR